MKSVLFTQRVDIVQSYGERRDCADQRISEFIFACGYIPVPMPNNASIVRSIFEVVRPSGVIFTGGNSLVKYGGNAPERDEAERELMNISLEHDIPVYGLCRGMQFILDYFGQDLEDVNGHVAVRHKLMSGREVNSYHNQACVSLESGVFDVLELSRDGVIEAVRHRSKKVLGTMWHPEREKEFAREDIDMLKKFIGGE